MAVAYRTLDGRSEVLIDPDKDFHAASTMKVPVMIELFRQVAAGTVKLDDTIVIRNEFHSIVDGSVYTLSEGDDSDKEVYAAVGRPMTAAPPLRADDHRQQQLRGQHPDREGRRRERAADRNGPRCRRHARAARRRGSEGLRQGLEQHHVRARADGALRQARPREGGRRAVRRRNDRDPRAAAIQRRHPGWPARRNRGGSQDRQHHPDPPRCRHRLRPAPVRAGDPGARDRRSEEERRLDGRPVATGVRARPTGRRCRHRLPVPRPGTGAGRPYWTGAPSTRSRRMRARPDFAIATCTCTRRPSREACSTTCECPSCM